MIGKLAVKTLTAHPVRSAVLAAGFGAGVAVMAILLGVAEVVLDQATSPELVGGGDVVIRTTEQVPGRVVLSGILQADALRTRVRTAAPWDTSRLYLVRSNGTTVQVDARGGIPSLERKLNDRETAASAAWRDSADDAAWRDARPEDAVRVADRFHPIPDAPAWSDSWAEWLYFNGRAADVRFYLTFLVGPATADGRRTAGVRLQWDRNGRVESYSTSSLLSENEVRLAPDLTIGNNRVRLEGLEYVIDLDLRDAKGRRAQGRITLAATPGRLVPPIEIAGAKGWRSGYVVPVMSGALSGRLAIDNESFSLENGVGYHDHNWGFWRGVSWQWGQAQSGDLSLLYGRVFPPADAADPDRIPGFVGVLGPDGPLGYATNVTISEQNDAQGAPRVIAIRGRSSTLDVRLEFHVDSVVTTPQGPAANGLDFLQMRGRYVVTGKAGTRALSFNAPGSAETFRRGR